MTGPATGEPAPGRHAFLAPSGAGRLDTLVAAQLGLSRTKSATLIALGHVLVGGDREKAGYVPKEGDAITVEIPPPPGRLVIPEQIDVPIAYEDDDLVVVDKPAGMVVHPAPGHWSGTLVNALLGREGSLPVEDGTPVEEARAGLVHRLDKDTSGLLIVAKTEQAHRILSADLAARRVQRRYAALARGHFDGESITVAAPIGRDPRDRKRMAIVQGGRAARTDFYRVGRFGAGDLVRAHLHTGRTHQIRVHLASIGHPVLGDETYGGQGGRRLTGVDLPRHFLHAAWLVFRQPRTGAEIEVRSRLPQDLATALAQVSGMSDLIAHPDPLEYLGFYRAAP